MPLDPAYDNPMYLLGRLVALLEGPFPGDQPNDRVHGTTLDNILIRPAIGLAAVMAQFRNGSHSDESDVAEILGRLPSDLPADPVPVISRGPYWLGYYQQQARDMKQHAGSPTLSPDALRSAGEEIYGPEWETALARDLRLTDSARVRSWMSSNPSKRRRVPASVTAEILAMLRQRSAETDALADEIEAEIKRPQRDNAEGQTG